MKYLNILMKIFIILDKLMHSFGKIIKKIFYLMEIMKLINFDFDHYLKKLGIVLKIKTMN